MAVAGTLLLTSSANVSARGYAKRPTERVPDARDVAVSPVTVFITTGRAGPSAESFPREPQENPKKIVF